MSFATRHDNAMPYSERAQLGALARLLTENWSEMTAAANRSARHVSRMERWERKAREVNPELTDDQVIRLAERLKSLHYQHMQRLSIEARRLNSAISEAITEVAGEAQCPDCGYMLNAPGHKIACESSDEVA